MSCINGGPFNEPINWNNQIVTDNYVGSKNFDRINKKSCDKSSYMNKSINLSVNTSLNTSMMKLSTNLSSNRTSSNSNSNNSQLTITTDKKAKSSSNPCAFNQNLNSSNLSKKIYLNESDKTNNHQINHQTVHLSTDHSTNHQITNQIDHQIIQSTNQNESVDFTTLHNDIISISDQDQIETSNQINGFTFKNVNSFQFHPTSSNFINHNDSTNLSSNHSSFNPSINTSNQMNLSTNSSNSSPSNFSINKSNSLANNCRSIDMQQSNVDDGLTNLSWLQNLNMCMSRLGAIAPTPPASPLCNLTPFSIISPHQPNSNQTNSSNHKSIKSMRSIKGENGIRKSKANSSKQKGSKATKMNKGVVRKQNKINNQNCDQNELTANSFSSSIESRDESIGQNLKNGCQNGIKLETNQNYTEINNSIDLIYNGDHPMLNSVNYTPSLCNRSSFDGSIDDGQSPKDEHIDFQSNHQIKPPFSYANLIRMAMQSNRNKMTLRSIYKWIRENFIYYRKVEPSWENSIRHNLSLNKCFVKIARTKEEPGKGGFWKLDPEHAENLVNGMFKRRKQLQSKNNQPDVMHNKMSEKTKIKKQSKQKRSTQNLVDSHIHEYNPQTTVSVCHAGDNLMMHDTPPNSAESYSESYTGGFIENQVDIEIANAVNSIDLINGTNNHTNSIQPTYNLNSTSIANQTNVNQSELTNQQSQILNDCNLTQCNTINDTNAHLLQPIHIVNGQMNANSTDHPLPSILPHQIITNQTGTQNHHYMIHVTSANNQEQITIEPMINNAQQLHSTDTINCAFATTNDLTQLTALNSTSNEICIENGSNINLTTLNNGQLTAENCLLTSDGDICWNTILPDELIKTLDPIQGTYTANTIPTLTAIPITSHQTTQIINPVINTQSSTTISNPNLTDSTTISNSTATSTLLTNAQSNNSNLIQPTTSTTNFCSTSNVDSTFTNHINTMSNNNLLHNSQVITSTHNVTCVNSHTSSNHVQQQQTSSSTNSWDTNANYMNLTFNNQTGNELTNLNNSTTTSLNDNHDSSNIMQINSNCLTTELNTNCNFDSSNSMPITWIECKTFESNAFDLEFL